MNLDLGQMRAGRLTLKMDVGCNKNSFCLFLDQDIPHTSSQLSGGMSAEAAA